MRTFRKLVTAVAAAAALAGSGLLAPAASAAPQEGVGHETRPGQPYGGVQRARDWLGSYLVGGEQVWCVRFALKAPETGEQYRPGEALLTKWGTPLPAETAANISYLLLRYGDTRDPNQAAALAHLLHSWTSAPRDPGDLDPAKPFEQIGYDVDLQYRKLPAGARTAVQRLRADAAENHGPWRAAMRAPEQEQIIGRPADWQVTVAHPDGRGVTGVPVRITATDAEVAGLDEHGIARTPADGGPLHLEVTPTGPNPQVHGVLATPADRPYVREAVHDPDGVQRVVSTGGEEQLTITAAGRAAPAPGRVALGKIDEQSRAGIGGVALRVSRPGGQPALRADGSPLIGPDGKPVVLTTGADGRVGIPDLRAPQRIEVTELAPARGYGQAFDPARPPSITGDLLPGRTLELVLPNKADTPTVPIRIPAGDPGASGGTVELGEAAALAVLGAAGTAGLLARRKLLAGRR